MNEKHRPRLQLRSIYKGAADGHNFAVWAGARAAQRSLAGGQNRNLIDALEASGVQRFLTIPGFLDVNCDRFEELHRAWCSSIVTFLSSRAIQHATYGRAAKLLAVYLKAMIIVGGSAHSPIGHCIHPPIDRRLLQALAGDSMFEKQVRKQWGQIAWTKLDEAGYYELIEQLRAALPPEIPFWMLEEHWIPSDEQISESDE